MARIRGISGRVTDAISPGCPDRAIRMDYAGLQVFPPYAIELWTILEPLGNHPKYSTLSRQTIEQYAALFNKTMPRFMLYHCADCKFMSDKYGKANAHIKDKKHVVYELLDDTVIRVG